jgi:transcriptional regulator with GAF, ATPase, and Fis domain
MTSLEKKQWELWGLSVFLLLCSTGTIIVFSIVTGQSPVNAFFLGVFALLFSAYIIDKEFKLQKIQRQLQAEQFKVLEEGIKNSTLQARLNELSTLQKAMKAIEMEAQPQKALDTILRAAMEVFGADRGSIMLVEETSWTLKIAAVVGMSLEQFPKSNPKVGEGIAGRVVQTGEALLLSSKINAEQYKNFEPKATELRSGICAPLWSRRKIMGVINYTIIDPKKRLFTEYDLKLLTIFAQYATLVLNDAQAASLK